MASRPGWGAGCPALVRRQPRAEPLVGGTGRAGRRAHSGCGQHAPDRLRPGSSLLDWAQVAAHLLPTALFLVCGVSVLLLSFFQREDLLRRRFAAAVMIGYLARELVYVLFFMLRLGS